MKIYYLKYYKGYIKIEEIDVDERFYGHSHVLGRGVKLNSEDEGKVTEYSLGDIRIWVTEKGDFRLAHNALRDYAINFHNKNIKYLNQRISEEEMFLSAVELLAIK